ncbi:hypothetical protein BD779DRAFT_1676648 [Infundibulicybe gibba]|nr:hypothetical protein BD779DRAFT_1676648 [Infundibulicybe gibba]
MLGGAAFQLAIIVSYILLGAEFFIRYIRHAPLKWKPLPRANGEAARGLLDKRMRILIISLVFSTTCLFIRSVYRTVELVGGFTGKVFKTEVYFNALDGGMVILAMFTLNLAHPGLLLKQQVASGTPLGADAENGTSDATVSLFSSQSKFDLELPRTGLRFTPYLPL